MPESHPLVPSLRALTAGDAELAARLADHCARTTASLTASALCSYLRGPASASVYLDPAAFEAFIRGGGNVALYQAVSEALSSAYESATPSRLLDIGCGDATALAPALAASRHRPATLDVVEPSAALLQAALARLAELPGRMLGPRSGSPALEPVAAPVRTWPLTLQELLVQLDDEQASTSATEPPGPAGPAGPWWDVAQATFSLHTIPPAERTAALTALRPRVGALVVVEFDVPDVHPGSDEHLDLLARSYDQGLAEYEADRDLVAQGFLVPVLTGQLAPGAVRATWEQPATAWADQLRGAGYTDVQVAARWDYWSSPAFLLTASGGA